MLRYRRLRTFVNPPFLPVIVRTDDGLIRLSVRGHHAFPYVLGAAIAFWIVLSACLIMLPLWWTYGPLAAMAIGASLLAWSWSACRSEVTIDPRYMTVRIDRRTRLSNDSHDLHLGSARFRVHEVVLIRGARGPIQLEPWKGYALAVWSDVNATDEVVVIACMDQALQLRPVLRTVRSIVRIERGKRVVAMLG